MNISIVGLGYVGTVSAACLSDKGHRVWGVDINRAKVDMINEGRSPIVEPGLEERLQHARANSRLIATCSIQEALTESQVCFVSVATPSRPSGQIDASHLFRACQEIARALSALDRPQIVVIRSSILPSIFDRCSALFETHAPGLVDLCVNPEFLREATAIRDFETPPFTVLGTDSIYVQEVLRRIYCDIIAPIVTLRPKEALMLKYASNAFHALKIAFANEIAAVCERFELQADEVMKAFCNDTQLNISPRYLMPGFAFGGSCLPKDVRALLHEGKTQDLPLPLIGGILSSNTLVIDRAFQSIRATDFRRIGLIGLAFKPDTDDLRESPYVELAERLLGKGYELSIYDPNVTVTQLIGANREYINKVLPHLSRLMVPSLGELGNVELLLVGHRFDGVDGFLENCEIPFFDLASPQAQTRYVAPETALAYDYAN
jgi:GDP-mannose 6-dehydrogenase